MSHFPSIRIPNWNGPSPWVLVGAALLALALLLPYFPHAASTPGRDEEVSRPPSDEALQSELDLLLKGKYDR